MAAALIVCGVALSIGICTRLNSTVVGVAYAVALLGPLNGPLPLRVDTAAAIVGMAAAIAVALLGPGALSIDARRFGRREIFIPGKADSR